MQGAGGLILARHPAYRQYTRRMVGFSLTYVAAIFGAALAIPAGAAPSPLSIGLALLPALATLGIIWTIGRLLIELDDEYLRLLEVRKFVVATGVVLALASVWGLLELLASVPRVPVFWAFPVWAVSLGLGQLYNRFTIGDGGSP